MTLFFEIASNQTILLKTTAKFFGELWFVWMPPLLFFIFRMLWQKYAELKYVLNLSWILLEIKLPREVLKGPQAMESIFSALHATGIPISFFKRLLHSVVQPWMSFEIVSMNGHVHFFVYTQTFFRKFVEAQFYGHYSGVEIAEADDYTAIIPDGAPDEEWELWGTEFGLTKEDAFPIKTYIDFKLDQPMVEEAQKVDPISSLIEVFGSAKEGEQLWLQILIRPSSSDRWKKAAEQQIDKLLGRDKPPPKEGPQQQKRLSKAEENAVEAIGRNIAKLGYDTGIRYCYVAKRDRFNAVNIAAMIGVMKQYNTQHLNGFKPAVTTSASGIYKILFKARRERMLKNEMLSAYKRRSYFTLPHHRVPFVFNTEELATIYHLPGAVSETPTFGRIEAKKGTPPPTLPV